MMARSTVEAAIPRKTATRERMEFERSMLTIDYLTGETAQPTHEDLEHYYRRLIQTAKMLSRRHGFKWPATAEPRGD